MMHKIFIGLFIFAISTNAFSADGLITHNIPDKCKNDTLFPMDSISYMVAKWRPNTYTCNPGYYLPANGISCAICPIYHTCPGGTYTFNETSAQGLIYNDNLSGTCNQNYLLPDKNQTVLTAVWQPNTYDCELGYYLPADGIECAICPNNNYCPGGTYTYSETIAQGIMECPTGLIAPSGMHDIGSCGRKLYIGEESVFLRSQKKTMPSLNVDINNDGTPDFFGNLTTIKTFMNINNQKFLHLGGYYLYDDSINLGSD